MQGTARRTRSTTWNGILGTSTGGSRWESFLDSLPKEDPVIAARNSTSETIQVHGDVFRAAASPMLFSSLIGTGAQLAVVVLFVVMFAIIGG